MGRIGRAHGTRGAVVVDPHTDEPGRRFSPGSKVFLEDGTMLKIRRYEATDRSPVVTFEGVVDRSSAETLRGAGLYIRAADRRALGEEEFWPDELVGLRVHDPEGAELGVVSSVEVGGSQDRLVVETAEGSLTIPLVTALVPVVAVADGKVVVDLPPGFTEPD